jgi:hypothetical protein
MGGGVLCLFVCVCVRNVDRIRSFEAAALINWKFVEVPLAPRSLFFFLQAQSTEMERASSLGPTKEFGGALLALFFSRRYLSGTVGWVADPRSTDFLLICCCCWVSKPLACPIIGPCSRRASSSFGFALSHKPEKKPTRGFYFYWGQRTHGGHRRLGRALVLCVCVCVNIARFDLPGVVCLPSAQGARRRKPHPHTEAERRGFDPPSARAPKQQGTRHLPPSLLVP